MTVITRSGVANCPCCGNATMVSDFEIPEVCDECKSAECTDDYCEVNCEDGECPNHPDQWIYADDPRDR